MNSNDIQAARTKIQETIQKLESDLQAWRDELKAVDRVQETMRRLAGGNSGSIASLMPVARDVVKRGHLKQLVLKAVSDKKGAAVSSTEVENALLQAGYKPTGKHFDISVFQTLNRLADKKVIKRKRTDGKVTYWGEPSKENLPASVG